jgi:hypothetical protein
VVVRRCGHNVRTKEHSIHVDQTLQLRTAEVQQACSADGTCVAGKLTQRGREDAVDGTDRSSAFSLAATWSATIGT